MVSSTEDRFGLEELFGKSPLFDYADLDLTPFRELPPDLWSESLLRINEGVNLYVDLQIHAILIAEGLSAGDTVAVEDQPPERFGVAETRRETWRWLLAKIARAPAVVETRGAGAAGGEEAVPLEAGRLRHLASGVKAELRTRLVDAEPDLEPALELIDVAAAAYPAFLRGEASGEDLLFRSENSGLWERYFANTNPLYAPVNRLTAFVASRLMAERGEERAVVLELGAGCGSASEAFLEAVRTHPALRTDFRYRITDIAPAFLRVARERVGRVLTALRAANSRPTPEVSYALLDLDRELEAWGIEEGSVDLAIAVNVLHTVCDLEATLGRIRRALRPGGQLLLGECVRPTPTRGVHPEFVFQLIEAFRDVKVKAPYRASWGFLDGVAWHRALDAAGFSAVRFVPDFPAAVAAYPEHTLAAIVADR